MKAFVKYIESIMERKIRHVIIDATIIRVGRLQVEVKPEFSKVRFLFNKIVVIPWKYVETDEDIRNLQKEALDMLKNVEVDIEEFADVLIHKYHIISERRKKAKKSYYFSVPIIELCSEVMGKKCDVKKDWTFVYNLDMYRYLSSSLPNEKRLFFETGSQSETENIGVVLNGIDPKSVYKKFCYVRL